MFDGFWPNFDTQNNIFVHALKERYSVSVGNDPDILFCSVFGKGEHARGYTSVFYTGEPVPPRMNKCDWAFSFDYDEEHCSDRHMRLPLYVLSTNIREFRADWAKRLIKADTNMPNGATKRRKKFCSYVSFQDGFVRCLLFDKLNKRRLVTAPGRSRNNAPPISTDDAEGSRRSRDWQEEKRQYLREFRFSIVCENTSYPGYTSEKLVDAMIAGCIPIYWGNPEVSRDFNTQSFIDVTAYEKEEAARLPAWVRRKPGLYKLLWRYWVMPRAAERTVLRVLEIDDDDGRYRQMVDEPWFKDNQPNEYFDERRFLSRMQEIARSAITRRNGRQAERC